MRIESHARHYIEQLAALHDTMLGNARAAGMYRTMLEHGQLFTKLNVRASKQIQKTEHCETKQCFYNAQRHILFSEGLHYYEGFAVGLIPVHHAWLVNPATGVVVDPTWAARANGVKAKCDYFGVHIPDTPIRKMWLETGTAGAILFDYLEQLKS